MGVKSTLVAVLLCSSAITKPVPAQAGPLVGVVSFLVGGAGFGAVTSIFGFAAGTVGFALVTGALRLGGSLLLSAAARALGPKPPGAPELIRELQAPSSLVPKRYIYGNARIYGSPVWRVRGSILYGCLVLNSRPSDAVTALYFDKRPCPLSGDIYDLAGPGASATVAPFAAHVSAWVGRGDQVACPAGILAEAPGLFQATDAGRGLTVLWLRLSCGENSARADRWPRTPPEVEVDGRWSKVWDPRDPAQDGEDPATWTWSANQSLCALDAARTNPIRQYPLRQIMLESFIEAADIADEAVPLKAGGTEPRYQVNGALIFNGSEIMDQLLPLFAAGASNPVRVGGRLAIAPGAYTAPIITLDDITEAEGLSFRGLKPGRELATTVHCTFTDPLRDWRTSDLADYTVPGAVVADGGTPTVVDLDLPLVTSPTQAMRIQKIRAMRQRAQRQITCTLPPRAFKVVAGANATVGFPVPYDRLNGTYRVASANPGLSASEEGGGGVAMRVPVVLDEIAAADYAWNAATEEQDRPVVALDMTRAPPAPPGAIGTTTGAAVAIGTGAGAQAAIRFDFDPSPSASVSAYEWQYVRLHPIFGGMPGDLINPWQSGGAIDAAIIDAAGKVFGFLGGVAPGAVIYIRVRGVGRSVSDWVVSGSVTATLDLPRYAADFVAGAYEIDTVPGVISNVISVARATTATYVNASGLVQTAAVNVPRIDHLTGVPCLFIEPAGGNGWSHSEALDDAVWTKTAATITADAIAAPNGVSSADKLVEDSSTGQHYLRRGYAFATGVRADCLLHAKAGERTIVRVRGFGTGLTINSADIDLTTGAVTIVQGAPDVAVYPLASGWFRIEFGFVPDASVSGSFDAMTALVGSANYAGDGVSGLYLWGLQDAPGSYVPTATTAESRAADVPAMQGISATLDLIATYDNGSTGVFDNAPVLPGYWPALTRQRLRSLIGTV